MFDWLDIHFLGDAGLPGAIVLEASHNTGLVILSFIIAVFASFTAIVAERRSEASGEGFARAAWMLLCAVALGCGVWSMHFIGMLAYEIPVLVLYEWIPTLGSLVIAVATSYAAIALVNRGRRPLIEIPLGGALMGLGIVFMHYVGMSAMRSGVAVVYEGSFFMRSVAFAIVAATAALALVRYARSEQRLREFVIQVLAALLMGGAMVGMHFTAIAGTVLHTQVGISQLPAAVGVNVALAVAISAVIIAIMLSAVIVGRLGRKLSEEEELLQRTVFHYDRIIENVPDGIVIVNGTGSIQKCNRAARRLFELGEDLSGMPRITDLVPRFSTFLAGQAELPSPQFLEMEARSSLGREFPVEISVSEVDDENNDCLVLVTRDVSARKRVENHIRKLLEENKRLAATDMLTGLPNRRYLLEAINKELSRCKRYGHDLSILVIDIDFFKQINDTFGHSSGDDALKVMARIIREIARGSDLFCRFGGEEFLVALPETSAVQAGRVAERLRERLENTVIKTVREEDLRMTCSVGVAQWFPGDLFDDTLAAGDRALYQAKRNGRNQVVVADREYRVQDPADRRRKPEEKAAALESDGKVIPFGKQPPKTPPT